MSDQLKAYVEEQLIKGYSIEVIRTTLLKSGYSPIQVESVLSSVSTQKYAVSYSDSGRKINIVNILVVILVVVVLIGGGLAGYSLLKPKEALLDVKTTQDRMLYHPGEAAGFDLEITNMGSTEKVDIELTYKLIDSDETIVVNKVETLAVRTTSSFHKEVKLPQNLKKGQYIIKVFANYEGKVAASSFSFDVEEKNNEQVSKGSCSDRLQNQDETSIDCGGVCGGYYYSERCNDSPELENTHSVEVIDESCSDSIKNQDEAGIDCGGVCGGYWYDLVCNSNPKSGTVTPVKSTAAKLTEIRLIAKTDSESAKEGCVEFTDEKIKDSCLRSVAQASMKNEYCDLIFDDDERDLCYYPFFMQGDYSVCEKLVLKESLQTCAQLRQLSQVQSRLATPSEEEPAPVEQ